MPTPDPKGLAAAATDPAAYATTMAAIAIDRLGTECLAWHPATIRLELEDALSASIPPVNLERLYAAATLLSSGRFYRELPLFCNLARVLSGGSVDPTLWTPPGAVECAWAITEALLLAPPEDGDAAPFADDVRAYLGMVLDDEGFLEAPDVLRLALRGPEYAATRRAASAQAAANPEVGAAARELQAHRRDDVESSIRAGLRRLLAQLEALPLEHGDASALAAAIADRTRLEEP